jgi:hypothetical protein
MDSSNPQDFTGAPQGDAAFSNSDFPSEAFECPMCGQLLAPSCRVCVSCKQAIDPAMIHRPQAEPFPVLQAVLEPEPPPVRFSWPMFFAVLVASWSATILALHFLGILGGQLAISGLQLVTAVWVFADARRKLIAKPLRWALGTLILWIVIFPWYLVRRQKLRSPCPFVERETSPFTRVMILVVFIFFLLAVLVNVLGGPANPSNQKPGGSSATTLHKVV